MSTNDIYFITSNKSKRIEIEEYFNQYDTFQYGYRINFYESNKINEIQSINIDTIVKDKVLKAYKRVMRPVFIDHSGISLTELGNIPGGVTGPLWESIDAFRFSELFLGYSADAFCIIGYCDGKKTYIFNGYISGIICKPRGAGGFAWDAVFLPDGENLTLAELKSKDLKYSARTKALTDFRKMVERSLRDER